VGGFANTTKSQTLTTLHSFYGSDGSAPYAGLALGSNGNFYGTTYSGGTNNLGTVFTITLAGALSTLYNFSGPDGSAPYAGLALGTDLNFYGTTNSGGADNAGTVFKLTPNGTLTTLHSFAVTDGSYPLAAVTLGNDGNFYGSTSAGGANGCGTIFKITPSGVFTNLYNFSGPDGSGPSAALTLGSNGEFYGTTANGGSNTYFGTIFSITTGGMLTTLHSFGFTDGSGPYASLTVGSGGNFYGATFNGGANIQYGTLFSMNPAGVLTTLHSFAGSDGWAPEAAVTLGANGNYYGTTAGGGSNGPYGTIFEITPAGTLTTLYNFAGTDASYPTAALNLGSDGNWYGTATNGGENGYGAVFRLVVCAFCPSAKVSSSANPSIYGNSVTFTATVTPQPGTGTTPPGSVTFADGSVTLGSAPLTGGTASLSTSALTLGENDITAAYGGDANFQPASADLVQVVNEIPSTLGLVTSLGSSAYNQPVTFTATVTPASGSGAATGTVAFTQGGTSLGVVTLNGGVASVTTGSFSVGTQWIDAAYSGSTTIQGSSGSVTQVVTQATSTVGLASNLNPAPITQSITFTAIVTGQYGGTPTGTVTFLDNGVAIGPPVTLAGGSASVITSFSTPGTYAITATYSGDPNFLSSITAQALSEVVSAITTNTSLSSSNSPSTVGHPVTFTAAVVASGGKTPNGVQVTFYDGSASIGTGTTTNGVATLTISTLPAGSDPITAMFAGNVNYLPSTSPVFTQVVVRNATATTLSSNLNPSTRLQSVTFTARVSSAGPTPTGTVIFDNGTAAIGSATLAGGVAVFSTSSLPAGTNSITAVYGGDANSANGSSSALSQVVDLNASSTGIGSSKNPSTYGQAVTFTATVLPTGSVTPTGTVTFTDGATTLGVVTLAGGTASITASTPAAGTQTIGAAYSGDVNFAPSGNSLQQVVNPAATSTSIVSSKNPSGPGIAVTFTATVTATGVTPAGTVTFTAGATLLGTFTLANGTAAVTTTQLPAGSTTITATFDANTDFTGSSASVKQTVT
jgi:uncharacterized repeat protein (TIGR03803 family)